MSRLKKSAEMVKSQQLHKFISRRTATQLSMEVDSFARIAFEVTGGSLHAFNFLQNFPSEF